MNAVFKFLLRPRLERLLRIEPESKPKVYLKVFDGADFQNLNYWLELILSAGIATLGLVLNSPAVVIGAMLVSPLMGPIIAAGLALSTADLYLGIKSGLQLALSILSSILFAGVIVWLLPLHAPTTEILARTNPNLLDLGVALFSGLAGSLLVSRSESPSGGGLGALPGVAIAVALMPPLCAIGFGLGVGFDWRIMYGAGLLFLTNLAAIVASAFLVFYLLKMDSVDVRLAIAQPLLERASQDGIYHYLERRTAISKSFANIGKLRWRVTMLVVGLGLVLFPLSDAMARLTRELVARDAVQKAIGMVVADRRESVISEQSNVYGDVITVQLITADPVDQDLARQAERFIVARTGREARLSVRRVASEEEISRLREGLARPAPAAMPRDIETMRADMLARLRRPLNELWPEKTACLTTFEIAFATQGVVVRLLYEAEQELDPAVHEVLERAFRAELGGEVELRLEGDVPPAPEPKTKR